MSSVYQPKIKERKIQDLIVTWTLNIRKKYGKQRT